MPLTIVEYSGERLLDPSNPVQSVYETSALQKFKLGTLYQMHDGSRYRYSRNGAAVITRGLVQQSPSLAAVPWDKYVPIAQTNYPHAIGDQEFRVLVTTGALATGLENILRDGYLGVTTGAGINDLYEIVASKHASETHVDVRLAVPLRIAIAATAKVGLYPNRWCNTIVAPATTVTAAVAGVPRVGVAVAYYYWAQTRGPALMTVDTGDTTYVIGGRVGMPSTSAVAGAVGVAAVTTFNFPTYGFVMQVGAADEGLLVWLDIE